MRDLLQSISLAAILAVGALHSGTARAEAAKPACTDASRQCLISVANAYIDALLSHDGTNVPLAPDVRRTENGLVNANGEREVRESFKETKMVKAKRNLHFVVDEQQGQIVAFFLADIVLTGPAQSETKAGDKSYKVAVSVPGGDYTVHEAERFMIENGLIKGIQIIAHVQKGQGGSSGWPD